jgi:hypothetical protein
MSGHKQDAYPFCGIICHYFRPAEHIYTIAWSYYLLEVPLDYNYKTAAHI